MPRTLFLGAICLLWSSILIAQSNDYYWADNNRIELTASNTHFIITADDATTLTSIKPKNVKRYESWAHKNYAVVELDNELTIYELIVELGFDTDEVQISPGYALSDGFIMYPTRTIVAQLIDKGDKGVMERMMKNFGVKEISRKFGTYRIELNNVNQALMAANALKESGICLFAHPDFYAPIERFQVSDPLFSQQFQMHNTGQTIDGVTGANDADCNALEAWNISIGSSSTTVAVIDDGLEDHEDLNDGSGQSRYTAGFSPANNGNGDAVSGSDHGVACAGSITASHNTIGVRGVAPLSNIISVNIFVGGESTQDIADGITWAKNQGADVMSNSWGYTSCSVSYSNINNALADANSNGRGGLGCVIVFASGNGYKSCVDFPANNANVIAVGAFANTGIRSNYSNYGPALDLVAPSNNVGGPGAGVRTTDRMGGPGYNSTNYTSTFGGTSSACPVVAGVATLVLGYNSNLTSTEVKNILYSTAIDMGSAGFDNEYANGRVNALGALQAAGGGGGGPTCTDGIQNGQETGVDCGGPDCPACPSCDNDLTLTIILDDYPGETTWDVRDGNGNVYASGGPYSGAGTTAVENFCVPDGCYDFTIYDSYGDGICCAYGNGAYTLTSDADGSTLASGGAFTSSETTNFCVTAGGGGGDTTPPSTPTGLNAYNPTLSTIDLVWNASTDNVGVDGYNVYMDGGLLGSVAGTSAQITGLAENTTYSFYVTAYDAAGNESSASNTDSETTLSSGGGGCTGGVVSSNSFESGWQDWNDGGSDCTRRNEPARSWDGNYSIRIRDNSGTASAMTSDAFDLSEYSSVDVEFYFYPNSMENGEDFWVRVNNGSGWTTAAAYASGSSFNNNSFYTATVNFPASSLSANTQFRFQCDASANNDRIYIDLVTITGNCAGLSVGSNKITSTITELETPPHFQVLNEIAEEEVYELTIYPNPTRSQLQIAAPDVIESVMIFGVDGAQLATYGKIDNNGSIDVSTLQPGLYFISIKTATGVINKKFIKAE